MQTGNCIIHFQTTRHQTLGATQKIDDAVAELQNNLPTDIISTHIFLSGRFYKCIDQQHKKTLLEVHFCHPDPFLFLMNYAS